MITFWSNIYSAFNSGTFYYTQEGNIISKQRIVNGKYREIGNLIAAADSWQLGMMKTVFNSNGLNFLSWETKYNAAEDVLEKNLYIVDTTNSMSIKSKNAIKFPVPSFTLYDSEGTAIPKEELPFSPSSFHIANNKIFIGYYYSWETKIDTTYMLICDYPGLTNVKLLKDARLGHVAFVAPYIIDVRTKQVVKDLNSFGLGDVQITMDSYTENKNELYVILKTSDARWFVAKYDADKNTLTRGVEINGGVTQVSRIARLK